MLVLALESSCDETAAAVAEDGVVLAELVRSQEELHRIYGGVVPEIASRAHLEAVDHLAAGVLALSGKSVSSLDGIAVTQGPGLLGALLVALSFAKGLALATGLPLTGVNHVKAHALAPFMRNSGEGGGENAPLPPEFPLAALVASGGHTSLFLMEDFLNFRALGSTKDDAAGEAFDKAAKLMGLGYPGGAVVERLARGGNPLAHPFKPPMPRGLDFSFSGLKTALRTLYLREGMDSLPADDPKLRDLAASFQKAAVDVLSAKLRAAGELYKARGLVLAGGVAGNGELRRACLLAAESLGVPLHVPKPAWCSDNAAMIGFLGALQLRRGQNILDSSSDAMTRWSAGS
ncbi:MAG: tRNA (adenosine(37)-N6)-threonylcarbamoyltransferase complex transferase subunit TsaD [Deltaproteobacteria bacterium]|jgi:N6-L-threonylcarbamoyladenine synthase|nr:tRNA (adenosine(37)-N6)-threonylcarbamoyltransferase complex transferase subunit TsaD [Deltaproteobacteria bacterium]